jgi:hypothetical protein
LGAALPPKAWVTLLTIAFAGDGADGLCCMDQSLAIGFPYP